LWNHIGFGICLRDGVGTYVLAQTVSLSPKYAVDFGEALGLLLTVKWLADMQFDNVDFVVDAKVTSYAFNSPRFDVTEFGHVITTCQNLFFIIFTNSRVEFSRR